MRRSSSFYALFVASAAHSLGACGPIDENRDENREATAGSQQAATIPAKGTTTTLDFGSWNLEWFGDPSNGPTDDNLQRDNVRDVIGGADLRSAPTSQEATPRANSSNS